MKKLFNLPMVEVVSFQSEDIICTSGQGSFFGPSHGDFKEEQGNPGVVLPDDEFEY